MVLNKPSNFDVYSVAMASLVETFGRVLGDPALPHLFFIEGDVLAVENAFKCRVRLDGSVQRSLRYRSIAGHSGAALAWVFRGRSGYTLPLTNTKSIAVARF
uniref:B1308_F3_87 n=1 Tax=Mycobacterium leprae TaxID=1769 RepID=Q49665_MYCLR|nr:B1308_F3_87 [Mycobacterium leprae]